MWAKWITLDAIDSPNADAQPVARRFGWARIGMALLLVAALGYTLLAGAVYVKQESLIFRPAPLPADQRLDIPGVEEIKVPVDGATLSAIHLRLPDPAGLVFFLHGNAGNLQTWSTNIDFYRRVNYDLFMIDYRGFGKSTGAIESEAQLHADVKAAWSAIAPRYAGKKIVIYGRSLGTGLAAKLASDVQPDLTVLVSPFLSLRAMGDELYPWLPGFISRYPMRSDERLGSVKAPVLIIHGDRDTLIPVSHAERLRQTRPATDFLVINGAAHNDIHKFPAYLDALAERLRRL
jgi:alpha-beta hydrolase superfamily lysophospholipase